MRLVWLEHLDTGIFIDLSDIIECVTFRNILLRSQWILDIWYKQFYPLTIDDRLITVWTTWSFFFQLLISVHVWRYFFANFADFCVDPVHKTLLMERVIARSDHYFIAVLERFQTNATIITIKFLLVLHLLFREHSRHSVFPQHIHISFPSLHFELFLYDFGPEVFLKKLF